MKESESWRLVAALVGVMMLAQCAATSCATANSTSCGIGACQGYIMINNVCTSTCAPGTYYQNTTGLCINCGPLSQYDCSLLCPGYFFSSGGSNNSTNSTNGTNSTNNTNGGGSVTCQPCSRRFGMGCVNCNSNYCFSCAPGMHLNSNSTGCISTQCNITHCVECSGSTGCYLCEPSYQVSPSGMSCIAVNCSVSYCSLCSGSNCVACISGYKLSSWGKVCKPICDVHCLNCLSPGVCAACMSGYSVDPLTYSCFLNCSKAFSGLCESCSNLLYCSTCKAGYVPALQGAICQPVFNCTDPHCSYCSVASVCTSCSIGYQLTNGTCHRDICYIYACRQCASAKKCQTCAANYVLNAFNTSCEPVCINNVPNCLLCNGNSTCLACNFGFSLSNNTCVPFCNISNCLLCLTSTTCLICSTGCSPSIDYSTCQIICDDPNCLSCNNGTSCTTCVDGYTPSSTGKCFPNCKQGQAINQNGVCQQCKLSLSNCDSCTFDSSDKIICTKCTPGYYLTSGSCFSCSSAISNCRLCESPNSCTACTQDYVVSSGACVRTCSAKNCLICEAGSSTRCQTCAGGFKVGNNSNCEVSCAVGMTLVNDACQCPLGTYMQSSTSCAACADSNCLVCTINSCSSCVQGYYASGSSCLPCMGNCAGCLDAKTCIACKLPYIYDNGTCKLLGGGFNGGVTTSGEVFTCDPGCCTCGMTPDGTKVCLTVLDGYSNLGGTIIKCHPSCKSCNGPSAYECITCYSGSSNNGGNCMNCTDPNAVSCSPNDATFSLTCVRGYTAVIDTSVSPSTSFCELCAGNCYHCDIGGPGTCDPGQCEIGYVRQPGNNNCTQCFGGCPVCDPNDLSNCLNCGDSRYTDPSSGQCLPCPDGCQNCNSNSFCTSCFPNYLMVGSLCQPAPVWPCVEGSSKNCTKCVQGYSVSNGSCLFNNECSKNATCSSCPYGYFLSNVSSSLQGICATCPKIQNCLTCSSSNSSSCFLCNNGFYVTSTGTCLSCSTGCAICTSGTFCTQAADGYFLATGRDGSNSGQVAACAWPCLTCNTNPNFCLSCMSGYSISGSTCFSNKVAFITIVFNYPAIFNNNDNFDVCYGKILNNIGFFRATMCNNLPKSVKDVDLSCKRNFNFLNFRQGSISSTSMVDISGFSSPEEAAKVLGDSNLLPGAQVISTSVTTSSTTSNSDNSSGTNLGLILGVSIPLGLLLLAIISIIIYSRVSKSGKEEGEDSGKPIEYEDVNPHDVPREGMDPIQTRGKTGGNDFMEERADYL